MFLYVCMSVSFFRKDTNRNVRECVCACACVCVSVCLCVWLSDVTDAPPTAGQWRTLRLCVRWLLINSAKLNTHLCANCSEPGVNKHTLTCTCARTARSERNLSVPLTSSLNAMCVNACLAQCSESDFLFTHPPAEIKPIRAECQKQWTQTHIYMHTNKAQ